MIQRIFQFFSILLVFSAVEATAELLPKYKLKPGTQLTYEVERIDESGEEPVVEKGSVRIVGAFHHRDWSLETNVWWRIEKTRGLDSSVYRVKLFPNGEKRVLQKPHQRFDFLPALPKNLRELRNGWTEFDPDTEGGKKYFDVKRLPQGQIEFSGEETGEFWELRNGEAPTYVYQFDKRNGVVTSIQRKYWKYTLNVTLKSIEQLNYSQLSEFRSNLSRYNRIKSEYLGVVEEARTGETSLMEQAKKFLTEAFEAEKDELVKSLLEARVGNHAYQERRVGWFREIDKKVGDKQAPDFELDDIKTGEKVSLSDYRGQVVILDFWAGWCKPCVQGVPKLRRLKKALAGEKFQFIGGNLDINVEEAKEAIDLLKLKYPNVNGRSITSDYGVRPIPTLFVIDKKGVVRLAKIGTEYGMEHELYREVKKLLDEE